MSAFIALKFILPSSPSERTGQQLTSELANAHTIADVLSLFYCL